MIAALRRSVDARLALAALLLRLLPVAALFLITPVSWERYLSSSDASSFIPVAKVLFGLEPLSSVKLYDTRVFPGWPLLFGPALAAGLPDASALALSLACSALVPIVLRRLTGETDLAWLAVYFTPAWLLAGFHPISEPAYCLATLAAVLALRRGRPALAGLLVGALFAMRPFGIAWAAAGGLAIILADPRDWRLPLRFAASAFVPVLGLLVLNARIFGDPLHQLHVYSLPLDRLNLAPATVAQLGQAAGHWDVPFKHVLLTPWRVTVPFWKIVYIYAHVAALLILIVLAVPALRRPVESWERALVLGFLFNAALILCTGPYWGFHSFDRYFVWGLPGALWVARAFTPRGAWHVPLALVSIALSCRALYGHLGS